MPNTLSDKIEVWRQWKGNTEEFFDSHLDGMGMFLREVVGKHEGSEADLATKIQGFKDSTGRTYNEQDSVVILEGFEAFHGGRRAQNCQ